MTLDPVSVRRLALAGFLLVAALLVAPGPAGADHCSYCRVEFLVAHSCCGDTGQAVCGGVTNPDGPGVTSCSTCRPGLIFDPDLFTCQPPPAPPPCSYCRSALGHCCGGEGQVACLGTAPGCNFGCQDGLTLRGGTCERPCSYCTTFVGSCCGDSGQLPCLGLGIESGCNFSCKDSFFLDNGYTSYVGTAVCQPEWQAPASPPAEGFDYTFFVATDVHIGYPQRSDCSPESAYDDMTRMINDVGPSGLVWPAGYEKAGQPIGAPLAVVMTGDLTVHGGGSPETSLITEFTKFRDYYEERRRDDDNGPSVNYPVYPGLGNHDLAEGCRLISSDRYCTRQLTKNNISMGYLAERMDERTGINYDEDSGNYSWDWGGVHFIQGHFWAGRGSGLQWLEDDLRDNVGTSRRPVVLFQHYGWFDASLSKVCRNLTDLGPFEPLDSPSCSTINDCPSGYTCEFGYWSDQDRLDLKEALAAYNVVGIFAGHTHTADWMPAKVCSGSGPIKACTTNADCPGSTCIENSDGPGFDVFTGEDGGEDENCEADKAAGRTPEGDGGFLVVRFADKGSGVVRMEVLQLRWSAPANSALSMTYDALGSTYDNGTRLFPGVSRLTAVPPVAQCANRTVAADVTCRGAASVDNGSYDPDGPVPACTSSPAGPYALGTTGVTLGCTDTQGLSDTCAATVTVRDESAPAIACAPTQVAECTGGQQATATFNLLVGDNCDTSPTTACDPPSGSSFPLGTNAVRCTATDDAGNQRACPISLTVVDTTRPSITCPAPQTVECTGHRRASATYGATASDVCWGTLPTTCDPPSGTSFAMGTTPLTCTATDGSGLARSCPSSVTVADTTRPVVTCAVATPTLWPPNHALASVGLTADATDVCDGSLPVSVSVFSNQDDASEGFSPDADSIDVGTLRLRRERLGSGERGRVYLIVTSATDHAGNMEATCCAVTVPHDNSARSRAEAAEDAHAAMTVCRAGHGVPPPGFVPIGER